MRTAGVGETSNYHTLICTNVKVAVCAGEQARREQIQVKHLSEILHRYDGKERPGVEGTTTPMPQATMWLSHTRQIPNFL